MILNFRNPMYYTETTKEKEVTFDVSISDYQKIEKIAGDHGFRCRMIGEGARIFVPISKKQDILFFVIKSGCTVIQKNYDEDADE